MASSTGIAGGGVGTGLLLLVGGLILKHSQANLVAECSSGFGQLGQALDPNAANSCSAAQTLSSLAIAGIWIGAIMLGFAVVGGIGLLAGAGVLAASSKKPRTASPANSSVRPIASIAATVVQSSAAEVTPVPPDVASDARQETRAPTLPAAPAAPTAPPGPGCGHEVGPDARFCGVCGTAVVRADS